MNYKIDKPNAYYMRGALPTVEQSRDEYIGSVYGAAALDYITIIHANEALDMLQERLPGNYDEARIYVSRITGTKKHIGETRKLELAIGDQLAHTSGRAWMAELSNATSALGSWRELRGKLNELQPLVTPGLDSRSNYGWNGGHCPDETQRKMIAATYYLYREMRHKYTLANKHNNVYSSPTLRCEDGGEPIKITWEE